MKTDQLKANFTHETLEAMYTNTINMAHYQLASGTENQ